MMIQYIIIPLLTRGILQHMHDNAHTQVHISRGVALTKSSQLKVYGYTVMCLPPMTVIMCLANESNICASLFFPWTQKLFEKGVYSYRKQFAPREADRFPFCFQRRNVFLVYKLTQGYNANARVVFPDSVSIYIEDIAMTKTKFDLHTDSVYCLFPVIHAYVRSYDTSMDHDILFKIDRAYLL